MPSRRQFFAAAALTALPRPRRQEQTPRPVPTRAQLRWQRDELAMFLHFGVNTFTDREWGDGSESPGIFNPARLDARQWARAARAAGFRSLILTAKHHDGFCLWPTRTTDHSVRGSPWRGGAGDLVRELADACRAEHLGLGLYLSPWDRHEPSYGDTPRYNDLYIAQLTELLTNYGPLVEVWFDGANGEGPNGRRQQYDWPRVHAAVRRLQPNAVMFSDAGPDVRWIGNEDGAAGATNWSTMNPERVPYAGFSGPGVTEALQTGDMNGTVWRPGETDVSIRPGWFWHANQDDRVRSPDNLLDLYFTSVGRNSKLLLNVPPTTDGLLHATDVANLAAFAERKRTLFAADFAAGAQVTASTTRDARSRADRVLDHDPDTYWSAAEGEGTGTIEVRLRRPARFDVIRLEEPIRLGQVIHRYSVEVFSGDTWIQVVSGHTIGYKKLDRLPSPFVADRIRVSLLSPFGAPRLSALGLHYRG